MTLRLRAHHLLCVLTYVGRGYSPAFTVNMTAIVQRLAQGEAVRIVEGPDDICRPLVDMPQPHCTAARVGQRDAQARLDVEALLGAPAGPGARLVLDRPTLTRLRAAFGAGTLRPACAGCEWLQLCSDIAADGFRHARL